MNTRLQLTVLAGLTLGVLVFASGCGRSGVTTYPVEGRVNVVGSDVKLLAGHTLEIAHEADPSIRAAGQIGEDGSFTLETVHGGQVLPGTTPGAYKARIVLADDDIARRNLALKSLPPKYLQFEKSGLSLQVPADEPASLTIRR